jgi:uncharacterized membrane protein YbhN (UPF0104 family)
MRRLLLPFKFAVSGLLIIVVFRNIDLTSFADRFAGQSRFWLIGAAVITLTQILLFALRWDQIVKGLGARVPIEAVIRVSYIGAFCNSWLIGNVGGDVARAALAPEGGIGRVKIIYSVLFDRVITLAGIGLVMLPVIALNIGPLARSLPVLASLAVAALPIIGLSGIASVAPAISGRASAVVRRIRELALSWRELCQATGRLSAALGIAAASQIAIPAVAYSLARAQHLDVSFVDFVLLIPPVVLVAALPISIGGWGVRENAMIVALAPIGVAAGSALLISIQLALLASLLSLPGGILWLVHYGLRRGPAATRQPARAP